MSDTTQTNAMAEIALALAMGFFSIMVLTLVSMGSVASEKTPSLIEEAAMALSRSQSADAPKEANDPSQAVEKIAPDDLVIYWQGGYLNATLDPMAESTVFAGEKKVLAVPPSLSMSETMDIRSRINRKDLKVVLLSDQWLETLKGARP